MGYAVVMVVFSPLAAAWATRASRMEWLVGGGLLVSGLGGVALLAVATTGWVFLAVVLVGVGQSMSISAQSALVGEHCPNEIAQVGAGGVYGVYRLLERLGNAARAAAGRWLVVALRLPQQLRRHRRRGHLRCLRAGDAAHASRGGHRPDLGGSR